MSQVKKLQTGGTAPSPTPKLKFKINGKDYDQDPQELQDMFTPVFDDMVSKGVAKERNREDFFKTFQQFSNQARSGVYNINSSSGKYLNSTYEGADGANLGVDERGNNSHKTAVGNIISPFSRDDHQRMAILNTYLGNRLIQHHNADDQAAKVKADNDAAKVLADKTKGRDDFINRFEDYRNPGKAIYGADGANDNWALGDFWRGKDSDRLGALTGAFSKTGDYLNDKQFEDAETQKAFKEKYGVDVNTLRQGLAKHGFNGGKFNPMDINGVDGLSRDLQLRSYYENYFVKPTQSGSTATTPTAATPGTTPTPTPGQTNPATAGFRRDKNGIAYKDGKIYSGINFTDTNRTSDFEDSNNGYYWQGKNVDKDTYFRNASSDSDLLKNSQAINQLIAKRYGEYTGKLQDINYNSDKGEGYNKVNINKHFAFSDLVNKGQKIPQVSEISNVYPDVLKNNQQRLFVYKASGKDRFGNEGLLRYRFVSPNGKIVDGTIKKALDGTDYLTDGKTNVHLGTPTSDPNAASQVRENPYMFGDYKEGGVIKAQLGAVLGGPKQDASFKSGNVRDIFDKNGLSTADKIQLGGVAADLGGLVAGFVPGGSVVAAGAGVAGTGAQLTADYMKHGFKWSDVGSAVASLGLDAATIVPGLGEFAKFAKVGKVVKNSASIIKGLLIANGALGAVKSLSKLTNDEHMNIDDWQNIAAGLQAAVAGKRALDNTFATKGTTQNTIKVGGVDQPISSAQATELRNASPGEQKTIATKIAQDQGWDPNKIDLTENTTRGFLNKFSAGKLGKTNTYEVPIIGQTKGRELLDYSKANIYQKQAIKNVVAQNPKIAGAENFVIGKPDGSIRANDNVPSWKTWVADSYKTRYAPNKEITAGTTPGAPTPASTTSTAPFAVPVVPKQLPASSGKTEGVNFVTPYTAPPESIGVSPTAHQGPMTDALQGKSGKTLDDILGKIQLSDTQSGGTVAAVNNKYHADQLREALGIKKGQSIKAAKLTYLFQGNGLTPEQIQTKDRFMNTNFGKNSYGEKLQNAIKIAMSNPTSKAKGVKFKEGGIVQSLVLKGQSGLVAPKIGQQFDFDEFWKGLGTDVLDLKPKLTAVNPWKPAVPKFAAPDKWQTTITPGQIPFATNTNTQIGSSANYGNKGINLGGIGDLIGNIDPNTVSELARALYTRQLNSQIDTRVERPLQEMPQEIATPVHGNLLLSNAANQQANQVIQRAGQIGTSDPAIRAATMLGANQQAAALRMQGEQANAQELERTRGIQMNADAQNAAARTNVANENIQTLARATQAERAANNDKFGRMNQPLVDFWKDLNYRNQVKSQQDKQYDTAIALQSRQNEFSQATRPMQDELNKLQFRQSQLEAKQYAGGSLTPAEQSEYETLSKRANEINLQFTGDQNKYSTASLLTRKNPKYILPTNYYGGVAFNKDGGVVAASITANSKIKVQEAKDNADNAQQIAKTQQQMIKDDQDTQAKKDLEASRQIAALIKMALS